MQGDFTRLTFDRSKHYSSVLKQQGRVALDADWNEQVAIEHHDMQRALLRQRPAGGKRGDDGDHRAA